ncbi:MAG: glycosyltransferase family 2 protein [Candidatus Lindowbacteria bacterium]|nr:glycosyltransferase family 2 protein [Candidatus Lindowbacteria bacterium]
MNPRRVSILLVNWNTKHVLLDCVGSVYETYPKCKEIIVVDNASTDDSVSCLREEYPLVHVVENTKNEGFAKACNQAIRAASGDYMVCLNPDTVVLPNSIDRMEEFLDGNEDVGMVGPMLLSADGTLQPSCRNFISTGNLLLQHLIPRKGAFQTLSKAMILEYSDHNKIRDTDWLIGACLMIRRSAVEQVGLFDETFYHFYEDADLCYRMRKAGWRVVFFPDAKIIHYGGMSSEIRWGEETILQNYRSKHNFIRKHYGGLHLLSHRGLISSLFLARLLLTPFESNGHDDAIPRSKKIELLKKALQVQWKDGQSSSGNGR